MVNGRVNARENPLLGIMFAREMVLLCSYSGCFDGLCQVAEHEQHRAGDFFGLGVVLLLLLIIVVL